MTFEQKFAAAVPLVIAGLAFLAMALSTLHHHHQKFCGWWDRTIAARVRKSFARHICAKGPLDPIDYEREHDQ